MTKGDRILMASGFLVATSPGSTSSIINQSIAGTSGS